MLAKDLIVGGGGPGLATVIPGLVTVIHCPKAVLMSGWVMKLHEARDAFLPRVALHLIRCPEAVLMSGWVMKLHEAWDAFLPRVALHLSMHIVSRRTLDCNPLLSSGHEL